MGKRPCRQGGVGGGGGEIEDKNKPHIFNLFSSYGTKGVLRRQAALKGTFLVSLNHP